ncbi:multicopper oxidase CueO [Vibrio nitrifigilis]|uniref:Multicopper oxidase CueO n=1 Tax=Vibrio nitrifigilis TaxID=2789781 RepID=A0ABS0GFI1_9VIBR|nr:multicopper oxidase CueO [Vibrio nitrifigilis]MBF9000998.1 multicopper oxidase CueO [Vibrio nitrifigilis]
MDRRHFLKGAAVFGAINALPFSIRYAVASSSQRIEMPVPGILEPDAQGIIKLTVQQGISHWDHTRKGHTYGYNGALLGPTLKVKRGQTATIKVTNKLPVATTTHWHGLLVPGASDGGPQQTIQPGDTWQTQFTVDQPAATCWYHPHTHVVTGQQVAMGLGGLFIVDEPSSSALALPNQWGLDDIPVVLQDKSLSDSGEVDYNLDLMHAAVGWFGNTMLTNGVVNPYKKVAKGWIRLRLLNGCNARVLNITTSDQRPLYVVGSDGGLLAEPHAVKHLPIMMGERFEVLIDARDGKPFDLMSLPTDQIAMTLPPFDKPLSILSLSPELAPTKGKLVEKLVVIPSIPELDNIPTRGFALTHHGKVHMAGMQALYAKYGKKAMGSMSGHVSHMSSMMGNMPTPTHEEVFTSNSINGIPFPMGKPAFNVKQGQYEIWEVGGMMLHPFHVHGTQFRILSENGRPPEPHRQGWKDTVLVNSSSSKVLVKFDHIADKQHAYMAHCHLLEHEDTGMMTSFTVS